MDCKEMLKENFVWAAKGKINSYSTATVFVTLTRHTYARKKPDNNHKPDTVIYANGPLTLAYIPHMPTNKILKGHVKAWINNEKSYKQSPFVLTPDIFPEMNGSYFDFTITPTGQVTIQFLSNGISDTPSRSPSRLSVCPEYWWLCMTISLIQQALIRSVLPMASNRFSTLKSEHKH